MTVGCGKSLGLSKIHDSGAGFGKQFSILSSILLSLSLLIYKYFIDILDLDGCFESR